MAKAAKKSQPMDATNRRGYWQEEIAKAAKRFTTFHLNGKQVVDRYRMENTNATQDVWKDRYNILYSSTETTRPSLYAQTPKVQATRRHRDRENDNVVYATMLMEVTGQYALEEIDFDDVMSNVVEDYLLPGLGQAWVRYVPTISKRGDNDNQYETLDFEGLDVDYVHYLDFLTGQGRVWKEIPWVARRVYFNKEKATARFGAEKANMLTYSYTPSDDGYGNVRDHAGGGGNQAIIWEIWDKTKREVVWYTDDFAPDLLDVIPDPLKLKDFFPCPRPVRAVSNTRTFIPKAFYSMYKAQAEELDNLTQRIRYLTEALRVLGVYDGSQENLQQLLTGQGNKMVPIADWTSFASSGGIKGSISWVPVREVAEVLTQLLSNREVVKNEIYEITGFSDIVRGVSKASETLGAQEIKAEWAGGRLRSMQKEIQRFCRDIIRIMSEVMAEQFSEESLALYAGFEPPPVTEEEQAAVAQYVAQMEQYNASLTVPPMPGQPPMPQPVKPPPTQQQQAIKKFKEVVALLKNEKQRCALIGVETDSTIAPDESAEREGRLQFLGQIGAFLQQAGPMALQYPDMRGLLGAIMMFAVRTFRSSRAIEKEFENFQKKLEQQPALPPPGSEGGDNGEGAKAAAEAKVQETQLKTQADAQRVQTEDATKRYEVDAKISVEREKAQMEQQYRMAQLSIEDRKLKLEEAKIELEREKVRLEAERVQIDRDKASVEQATKIAENERAERSQEHSEDMDLDNGDRADRQLDAAEKADSSDDKK